MTCLTTPRTVLSFFTGAMGLDIGLERAGLQTLLACENNKHAQATIRTNRPDIPVLSDIWEYDAASIRAAAGLSPDEDVDVMAGGPPCQSFSVAGTRRGLDDERGNVFLHYLHLITEIRPRYAVIENVRGLLSATVPDAIAADYGSRHDSDFTGKNGVVRLTTAVLEAAGYTVRFTLYNAANYGVPQKRERVVLIASRDGEPVPYLAPTHAEGGAFGLTPWTTVRDAIGGMDTSAMHYRGFSEKRLRFYRMLTEGQNWKNLPEPARKEAMGKSYQLPGGKTGHYRRLAWDKPSTTLVTSPMMPATSLCHPVEDRPLSVEEYKRIQQFPDDWELSGGIAEQYKQVGNAVPVGLGEAIGKAILHHAAGITKKTPEGFRHSRYRNTSDQELVARQA